MFSLLPVLLDVPKFVFIDPGDSVLMFFVLTLPLKPRDTASVSFMEKAVFLSRKSIFFEFIKTECKWIYGTVLQDLIHGDEIFVSLSNVGLGSYSAFNAKFGALATQLPKWTYSRSVSLRQTKPVQTSCFLSKNGAAK